MFIYGTIASAIGIAIVLVMDWFPDADTTDAEKIDRLYDWLMVVSVPIFVLVMAVAIYSVIRFRARPGDTGDGAPIHGNAKLEVIWVLVPTIIVSALAAYGWIVLDDVEAKKDNELTVDVYAQQFAWRFDYPQRGGRPVQSEQLILPKDRPVYFRIHTDDVIHSFWVPEFRLKQDAVPGITTRIRVTPDKIGNYRVVCTELCGIGHATMRQTVRVVSPAEFDGFIQRERQGGGDDAGNEPQPEEGAGGPQG